MGSEVCTIFGAFLKRIKKFEYKIRYRNIYIIYIFREIKFHNKLQI